MKKPSLRQVFGGAALVLSMGSLAACGMPGQIGGYSEGDRVGTVTKLSFKGNVCKSWEGQLAMSNFTDGSNTFEFSVDGNNLDVIMAVRTAMESGDRVSLHYKQDYTQGQSLSCNKTEYHVVGIRDITKEQQAQQQSNPSQPAPAPEQTPKRPNPFTG
jgi:hypothetical protein